MSPSDPPETSQPESLRLTGADFDAYLPARASSNAFTRPRLELKQRTLAWARGVTARLLELRIGVEATGSDEHPSLRNGRRVACQRVFFWRDAAARAELERLLDHKKTLAAALGDPAPHQKHAFLALKIDSVHVEVCVEMHADAWVDARNLRARLADPERAIELTSALEALPEQFTLGLAAAPAGPAVAGAGAGASDPDDPEDDARTPAQQATAEQLRHLADRSEQLGRPIWIGWSVPRDVAVTHSAVLDEQLEDAIVALGPVFKLIAWAPDNDLLVLGREWEAQKADRARAHAEAEREQAAWEEKRDRERKARRTRESQTHAQVERERERVDVARDAAPEGDAAAAGDGAPSSDRPSSSSIEGDVRGSSRAGRPRMSARRAPLVTEVDPTVSIDKGTRVRVLAGPFVGKIGTVQAIDGKGGARVLLGLLATRFDVKDLVASAEGRDRPALATSHRKPLPVRQS